MHSQQIICKNCGHVFPGKYCNHCGEKVYTAEDKKLSHVFKEVFHFITHFDTQFLRTVWLVFSRPGWVAKEYCDGKRKKYFKPVSLFLISVVIYLLFPLLQGMNISFSSHIGNNQHMHLKYSTDLARHKMMKHHMTEAALAEKFDHISPKFAKILLLLLLPLSAFSLSLIFRRKEKYFYDHFILSTEFNTFFLLSNFIVLPLLIMLLSMVLPFQLDVGDNIYYGSVILCIIITFLVVAFRRFYEISYLASLFKSILFLLTYLMILFIYRQVTFMVVMLFI